MTLDKEGLRRFNDRYRYVDPIGGDPIQTLAEIVTVANDSPDEDLVWVGVVLIDPLLDCHWDEIVDAFEVAMRTNARLRMAFSCAAPGEVPEEQIQRLMRLVGKSEHVGDRPPGGQE